MAALGFTPARQQDVFSFQTSARSGPGTARGLSGDEARRFYETLTNGEAPGPQASRGRFSRKDSSGLNKQRRGGRDRGSERLQGGRRRARADPPTAPRRRAGTEPRAEPRRGAGADPTAAPGRGAGAEPRAEPGADPAAVPSHERSAELQGLRLLRCASEGDLPGIRELLSKGVHINFQDTFFWTAMMCASWSGQRAVVKLLLQRGAAWVGVVDMQGRDARDLALEAGHNEVLEELDSYGRSPQRDTRPESRPLLWLTTVTGRITHWFPRASNGSPTPGAVHFRKGFMPMTPSLSGVTCAVASTAGACLHTSHPLCISLVFGAPHLPPFYCLPPSSNSYKMMVRCGWKPGMGLGPEGEGPHQPVPTVLKRDQKGLGYGQMKRAKVTHFRARDSDAVKPPPRDKEEREGKGKRKEETRRKEQKDKNWERDFRASFYL